MPLDSIVLARPAVDITTDGERLLLLENSGTRIVTLSPALAPGETIPLTTRLAAPLGIRADPYYIYVFDHTTLYRMSKEKLVLSVWLNSIRVAGLANYAPAEMLVSDAVRGVVWYKTLFQESRLFLDASDVSKPGPIVTLPDGLFGVVTAGSRLVCVNRTGIRVRSLPLPAGTDLIVADPSGRLYAGNRGKPLVWTGTPWCGYELVGCASPVSFALGSDRLFVLDSGTRILTYSVPGQ